MNISTPKSRARARHHKCEGLAPAAGHQDAIVSPRCLCPRCFSSCARACCTRNKSACQNHKQEENQAGCDCSRERPRERYHPNERPGQWSPPEQTRQDTTRTEAVLFHGMSAGGSSAPADDAACESRTSPLSKQSSSWRRSELTAAAPTNQLGDNLRRFHSSGVSYLRSYGRGLCPLPFVFTPVKI